MSDAAHAVHKLAITLADRDAARTIAGALEELVAPAPDALTIFEHPAAGTTGWRIEAYYSAPPDTAAIAAALLAITGLSADVVPEPVPDLNWVAISQAALPPVAAGRFTVHGSHDRSRVAQGPNAIEIDAGEAFGTAHHATTYGCLLAIDRLSRRRRPPRRILDLGCGSGVLAIALARTFPASRIDASDADRPSIRVAAANARTNRAAARIAFVVAHGFAHARLRRPRTYDLIAANILAGPLIALAGPMAQALKPGGTAVLSGLLSHEAARVRAVYRAHGFLVVRDMRISGWAVLVLLRAPAAAASRQRSRARRAA